MLKIDKEAICLQHTKYLEAYDKAASVPLKFRTFVPDTFTRMAAAAKNTYPKVIKLPKTLDEMLEGDFSPSREIIIDKPITKRFAAKLYDEYGNEHDEEIDLPIWFGCTQEEIHLRFGYENGDSRLMSKYFVGDKAVSAIMGGSTGSGKSACINNMIYNMCLEYAPWELDLIMSDAKIVEFKQYALNTPLPHISAIAATEDADYLISIYEDALNQINLWQHVFTKAGASNIMTFRDETGLAIPRHLIIGDEFQTMFKKAGKKINHLNEIIDMIARLGRNAGFHLFFASQELGSEIKPETLSNITVRACLGAFPAVSEKLLNNDEAKANLGLKGRLIVNDQPALSGKESIMNNKHFIVPFITDNDRVAIGKDIIEWGKEFDLNSNLSFYDEASVIRDNEYDNYLKQFHRTKDSFCLGEPSFVQRDRDNVLKFAFTNDSSENVVIATPTDRDKQRYMRMLHHNLKPFEDKVMNMVVDIDTAYRKEYNVKSIASRKVFYSDEKIYSENIVFKIAKSFCNRRRLLLNVDKEVFEDDFEINSEFIEQSDRILSEILEDDEITTGDTALAHKRANAMYTLLCTTASLANTFDLELSNDEEELHDEIFSVMKNTWFLYQDIDEISLNNKIEAQNFKPIYVWVLGLDKMVQIGRDSKSRYVDELKQMLSDSTETAVRFLLFCADMYEFGEIRSGVKWYLGTMTPRFLNASRIESYPTEVSNVQGVLSDTGDKKISLKFKKMFLDDERIH